jgi:hypothetical protein
VRTEQQVRTEEGRPCGGGGRAVRCGGGCRGGRSVWWWWCGRSIILFALRVTEVQLPVLLCACLAMRWKGNFFVSKGIIVFSYPNFFFLGRAMALFSPIVAPPLYTIFFISNLQPILLLFFSICVVNETFIVGMHTHKKVLIEDVTRVIY